MAIKEIRGSKENLSRGFKDVGIGFLLNTFTKDAAVVKDANAIKPVSYTHLTLPTICSV